VIKNEKNIRIEKVGVKRYIDKKLKFKEIVKKFNIEKMKELVRRGKETNKL
jgi:DNA-directed RNA polymerase beta' subunit